MTTPRARCDCEPLSTIPCKDRDGATNPRCVVLRRLRICSCKRRGRPGDCSIEECRCPGCSAAGCRGQFALCSCAGCSTSVCECPGCERCSDAVSLTAEWQEKYGRKPVKRGTRPLLWDRWTVPARRDVEAFALWTANVQAFTLAVPSGSAQHPEFSRSSIMGCERRCARCPRCILASDAVFIRDVLGPIHDRMRDAWSHEDMIAFGAQPIYDGRHHNISRAAAVLSRQGAPIGADFAERVRSVRETLRASLRAKFAPTNDPDAFFDAPPLRDFWVEYDKDAQTVRLVPKEKKAA